MAVLSAKEQRERAVRNQVNLVRAAALGPAQPLPRKTIVMNQRVRRCYRVTGCYCAVTDAVTTATALTPRVPAVTPRVTPRPMLPLCNSGPCYHPCLCNPWTCHTFTASASQLVPILLLGCAPHIAITAAKARRGTVDKPSIENIPDMNTVAKESAAAATRSQGYLETLMAGAARIDLEGNQVGKVTASDEEDAKRKIAKAARRVAAKADRKAASQAAAKSR